VDRDAGGAGGLVASRNKNTCFAALYRGLAPHQGRKRALIAVADSLLEAAWFILARRQSCRDPGCTAPDFLDSFFDYHHAAASRASSL